jgi:hypothetical protein
MKNMLKTAGIITALLLMTCINSFAQQNKPAKQIKPVTIAFDDSSKRIDLITGKQLPDYKLAQRDSFQFFLTRLDSPDNFFNFYHDGLRQGRLDQLEKMEKIQPKFAIWRLYYKDGNKNTPRVHHQAISFIPIDPNTNLPDRRVYVRMDDLKLIDMGKDK